MANKIKLLKYLLKGAIQSRNHRLIVEITKELKDLEFSINKGIEL